MENNPSPLDTLRQLKEWLDAGTITPQEFETLKRKLLFNETTGPGAAVPAPEPIAPVSFSTSGSPVEEPLLPPVVRSAGASLAAEPLPPSAPAAPAEPLSRPIEAGRPDVSPVQPAPPAYEAAQSPAEIEPTPYTAPAKSPLGTILIVGGIVALLAIVGYLMLGNRSSERLTSTSQTAADTVAVAPEEGPQAEQIELTPVAPPETVRVAPAVPPPVAAATDSSTAAPTTETPAAPPAEVASATDNAAAQTRAQQVLEAYYADLQTAPFDAAQHFAPTVERFYTQSNVTPAAINDELVRTHFPEFTEAQTQIEPGSLKVGPVANDGSRVVTFVEKSQAFRQSMQKRQQTAAQVRVRLDKNFKIMYLRQEKLLENTFGE